MIRWLITLLALSTPAYSQTVTNPAPVALVCAYNSSVPAPVAGQFFYVQCDSNGKLITDGGGGGGSPGGSDGSIQFNDGGTFGGISGWSTDGANALIGGASATLTVGTMNYNNGTGTLSGIGTYDLSNGTNGAWLSTGLYFPNTAALQWSATSNAVAGSDVFLYRDAAGILAQRNGVNAQSFRVYNTYTDASNYERGIFDWTTSANILMIGSQNAGTGSSRRVQIFSSGGGIVDITQTGNVTFGWQGHANYWTVSGVTGGHLLAVTDNAYDIGASAANRPRNIYAGTGFGAAGSAGVSCTGAPTASFASVGGIVTHC